MSSNNNTIASSSSAASNHLSSSSSSSSSSATSSSSNPSFFSRYRYIFLILGAPIGLVLFVLIILFLGTYSLVASPFLILDVFARHSSNSRRLDQPQLGPQIDHKDKEKRNEMEKESVAEASVDADEPENVSDTGAASQNKSFREGHFRSPSNMWIYTAAWLPSNFHPINREQSARAVVFLCHGFGEHIGRVGYNTLANYLIAENIIMIGMDHVGHGKSDGDRAHIVRFSDFVNDYLAFITFAMQHYGIAESTPLFLFAHSLGGLIGLHVLNATNGSKPTSTPASTSSSSSSSKILPFTGAVLSAPACFADPKLVTPVHKVAARVLSVLFPKLPIDKVPANLVTRNPEAVAAYDKDPLIYHGGMRARFGAESLRAQNELETILPTLTLPILCVHGGEDQIIPPDCSRLVFDKIKSTTKQLIIYDNGFHEMFEDPDKDKFFNDIVKFILANLNASSR